MVVESLVCWIVQWASNQGPGSIGSSAVFFPCLIRIVAVNKEGQPIE